MAEKVGIVGLGRMGWALAERLSGQGFSVCGWTRSGVRPGAAEAAGFRAADDLADLAESSDIIISSLFDEGAVRSVLGWLAEMDLSGKLVVETSTVSPAVARDCVAAIEAAGGRLVDAPISGGPEMVAEGTLGLFIGGSEEDAARLKPVLDATSNRSAHIGPIGAGAAMKIVNNVALAGAFHAAGEALELGDAMGLDLETMLGVLADSPGTTPMFKARIGKIAGTDAEVGFGMDGVVKDMSVFLDAARTFGIETPALEAFGRRARAVWDAGYRDQDAAIILRHRLGIE